MKNNAIKLYSLNIEKDKHLPGLIGIIKKHNPDAVCLQEVFERDYRLLKDKLGMGGSFAVMTRYPQKGRLNEGICLLTRGKLTNIKKQYYFGSAAKVPTFELGNNATVNRVLLSGNVTLGGQSIRVGTTHFTWSKNGRTSPDQKRDVVKLLRVLKKYPKIIFCGDMNAPRGREIFRQLTTRYTDQIPRKYHTSINGQLHKAGYLKLMVDCLFSMGYNVRHVQLIKVPSDHYAITADIDNLPNK